MWHIWLILAGISFILEIITTGFFVFWFGIGALLAMLVSFFVDSPMIQTTVFIISSSFLIILTKPLVDKIAGNKKVVLTNAYTIIGKTALVTEEINTINGIGQVKIGNEIWSAKSLDGEIISKDSNVEIVAIDGVKACVKLIPTNKFSDITNT